MPKYYVEVSLKGGNVGVEFDYEEELTDLDESVVLDMARMKIEQQLASAEIDFWSKS